MGLATIDPLEIPAFDIVLDQDTGMIFKLRNLHVTGIKNQKLHAFRSVLIVIVVKIVFNLSLVKKNLHFADIFI